MADLSDVSNMLVAQIAAYLYPSGTSNPVSPVVGFPVKVYAGWPQPESLAQDLGAGMGHISVYPSGTEKVLTVTLRDWQVLSLPDPTIEAEVTGQTVTLSGVPGAGQNVAILADGKPYIVAAQEGNTLAGLATALATLISVDQPATAAGAVVTVPGAHELVARVGVSGTMIRELRRQQKVFQITAWASCHDERDKLGAAIDQAIEPLLRAMLADGSLAIFHYRKSLQDDSMQKQRIYRRDVFYAIDYSTTQTTGGTSVIAPQAFVVGGVDVDTTP
ncbi:hypothetical protein Herbaro_09425 [Herbaspirillum sp. WKF16]|uniref:hypothetical protein n=1 Tax=Herbaspirillum sp. WKF16 TaxID=3028312 RepID=UPI0023A9C88F|nr:hypothetical protein [Herbaspirillum sp. WKF16]WDZ97980.1 hypothetical protein Herbaro_09425 [Herbaspirillum sp. WKF16]